MAHWLYLVVVYPIEILLEATFSLLSRLLGNPGPACIGVSVVISLLMLPMYMRADAIQEDERRRSDAMAGWVSHIRRAFSGDERVMVLSEYYRQQGYRPVYQLRSSISLLLQVPFFMAAYNCLSSMQALQGASFLGIADLGAPDSLLSLGGVGVNVLPVLMTAINAAACWVYNRGRSLREQAVPYGLALAFLVLLYDRPAGLVLYWTCNQVFSLGKNVFMKVLRRPREVAVALLAASGTALVAYLLAAGTWDVFGRATGAALCAALLAGCWAPLALSLLSRRRGRAGGPPAWAEGLLSSPAAGTRGFVLCCAFLAVLTGALIPVAVVSDSPLEFVRSGGSADPLRLVAVCACVASGVFLFWAQVFHYLMGERARAVTEVAFLALACVAAVNYLFFGTGLGNMSSRFVFDDGVRFGAAEKLLNLAADLAVAAAACAAWRRRPAAVRPVLAAATAAMLVMVGLRARAAVGIMDANALAQEQVQASAQSSGDRILRLSRTGRNVVFIGIDRAINADFPVCLSERPELADQFAGFTYYPNTMSFGHITNVASPSLFGGYRYTPASINSSGATLEESQNNALRVMPVGFAEAGWDVTVCDPPYAGYTEDGDLSIFDGWDNISAYHTIGAYDHSVDDFMSEEEFYAVREARVFRHSVMKVAPEFLQPILYDGGRYFGMSEWDDSDIVNAFPSHYAVLQQLPMLTQVTDEPTDCFVSFYNAATHRPCQLQLPDYTPALHVDNADYYDAFIDHLTAAEGAVQDPSVSAQEHYMANMASYMQVGAWLDYLREEGVYDNTRIIIAADHGMDLHQFDYMLLDNGLDVMFCNPLFLVKDFGSTELTLSDEFMTEADVPTLAFDGVVDNPSNPFTGEPISNAEKLSGPQYLTTSLHWHIHGYNTAESTQLDLTDGEWWSVQGDIFDSDAWSYEGDGQLPDSLQ